MLIRLDDLTDPRVHALLEEHLQNMRVISPPCRVHALDLAGLRRPEITFWSVWDGDEVLGCGALKQLDPTHGEVKSMRTAVAHRRKGVARAVLERILTDARSRGYARLSLETGAAEPFAPAHRLYETFGFVRCWAFADYPADPNSVFMTLTLTPDE